MTAGQNGQRLIKNHVKKRGDIRLPFFMFQNPTSSPYIVILTNMFRLDGDQADFKTATG